jgi:hypothetical protein
MSDMSAPSAIRGLVGLVEQVLRDLEGGWGNNAPLKKLTKQAKSVLTKLRTELRKAQLDHVAEMVMDFELDEATDLLQKNYPGSATNAALVEEVLAHVCVHHIFPAHLMGSIEWVGQLDVRLQPRLYEFIFEQIKSKGRMDRLYVLLLSEKIAKLPDGVLDSVRSQLDSTVVLEKIFKDVDESLCEMCDEMTFLQKSVDGGRILSHVVAAILQKFDVRVFKNHFLLIHYCEQMSIDNSCF